MSNQWYLRNPQIHGNRRKSSSDSSWIRSFSCMDMKPLIICRGPIRMEAMCVFEEMGISGYGILLSEKDSIIYRNALSPELRKDISPACIHRVQDYSGSTAEARTERINQIVNIARANGYDSVFAGYGFMAEDEEMVAAMEAAGLNFIGPCSRTIKSAGRKDLAKRTALQVDVSVIPGIDNATILTLLRLYPETEQLRALVGNHNLDLDSTELEACDSIELTAETILNAAYEKGIDLYSIDDLAETLAEQVRTLFEVNPGIRIRLKAIGGGGGKGQRILQCPTMFEGEPSEQLQKSVANVASQLLEVLSEVKATGVGDNKNVLAEANIESVRHEEIQVVGNGQWCITMGGRDCSVQMNEQKLLEISITVEELEQAIAVAEADNNSAAAATLQSDLSILKELEDEACRFGAAVGLDSVSTFECIVEKDRHYFMEMNTRVQVEHRVTELCYSLRFSNPDNTDDSFEVQSIVELMVLLAQHGSRLPMPERQNRENSTVEVRLNATDDALKPHAGGIIAHWSDPIEAEIRDDQGICLRNPDTGVFMKYHLAGAYDSNIALLLTTGKDREESFSRMAEILRQTRIAGENLSTNLDFHYGLIHWLIGNGVNTRPATNFVTPYLTAVGQLKKTADQLDIVHAYSALEQHQIRSCDNKTAVAMQDIFARKTSLFSRVLNRMLAEPHFLAGWLATNKHHFEIHDFNVKWLTNPVLVLSDLYHYLNMNARDHIPALYAIWDHDRQLLETSIEFYLQLEQRLGCDDWRSLNEILASTEAETLLGADLGDVRAAHQGFQLGMEILSTLPYIGARSGFFDLRVKPDLTVEIPERLLDVETRNESMIALSPPSVAATGEIIAPTGGMYYAREAPDRDGFVSEGEHFEQGDPLFIIEVMKMFNKVHAPFAGTIEKSLIDADATIIKKGQVVFKVIPDEAISEPVGEQAEEDKRSQVIAFTDSFLATLGVNDSPSL